MLIIFKYFVEIVKSSGSGLFFGGRFLLLIQSLIIITIIVKHSMPS